MIEIELCRYYLRYSSAIMFSSVEVASEIPIFLCLKSSVRQTRRKEWIPLKFPFCWLTIGFCVFGKDFVVALSIPYKKFMVNVL